MKPFSLDVRYPTFISSSFAVGLLSRSRSHEESEVFGWSRSWIRIFLSARLKMGPSNDVITFRQQWWNLMIKPTKVICRPPAYTIHLLLGALLKAE